MPNEKSLFRYYDIILLYFHWSVEAWQSMGKPRVILKIAFDLSMLFLSLNGLCLQGNDVTQWLCADKLYRIHH